MEILFVLWVKLCPDHLFKAVGLGVDEFGVLRDRQVGVTNRKQRKKKQNNPRDNKNFKYFRPRFLIDLPLEHTLNLK